MGTKSECGNFERRLEKKDEEIKALKAGLPSSHHSTMSHSATVANS